MLARVHCCTCHLKPVLLLTHAPHLLATPCILCPAFDAFLICCPRLCTLAPLALHASPATSHSPSQEQLVDVALGKVQIPVMDVVRNGSLKSSWPLTEAESGVISMKLIWQNCYV